MTASRKRRWGLIAALLAAAAVAFVALFQFGVRALRTQVEKALGPDSEVADIRVGWGAVEVLGLRLKGSHGWPAKDTLRAGRILVEPELRTLFADRIQVSSIVIEDAYISVLRSADGRTRVVPSLLESHGGKTTGATPKVQIGRIELRNAAMEFYDGTVARPPYKITLEHMNATVDNVELPEMKARTALNVEGVLKGRHRDGRIAIKGWIALANLDSAIASRFRDIELAALQPYLIKAADTGVRAGTLDLDLDATVENKHLHAPGTVILKNLELDAGNNFMGHARQTAMAAMKDSKDRLTVKFVLEGNLDDPGFSVNDNFATRFGSGLAEVLGVSVEGVAKGVGTLGQKSLEAAGGAAGGLGKAVGKLFGK
jgi:hypothetical protein